MLFILTAGEKMENQLRKCKRITQFYPNDGHSFLKTIADQLKNKELDDVYLKNMVYSMVKKSPYRFLHIVPSMSVMQLLTSLHHLQDEYIWKTKVRFVILKILHKSLNVKLVLLRHNKQPIQFPDDGQPITVQDIVIIENDSGPHYDSTEHFNECKY